MRPFVIMARDILAEWNPANHLALRSVGMLVSIQHQRTQKKGIRTAE